MCIRDRCKHAHVGLGGWYNRPSAKVSIFVTPVHLLSQLRANTGVITKVHPDQHERRTHSDPGQVLCLVLQQCFRKREVRGQSPPPHETFSPAMLPPQQNFTSSVSPLLTATYLCNARPHESSSNHCHMFYGARDGGTSGELATKHLRHVRHRCLFWVPSE